jgi:hypothetical protein
MSPIPILAGIGLAGLAGYGAGSDANGLPAIDGLIVGITLAAVGYLLIKALR